MLLIRDTTVLLRIVIHSF